VTRRPVPLDRLGDLLASERGLTEPEAGVRRERYGANAIIETPPARWRELARDTAKDPMLWFLTATSLLYAVVGQLGEALTLVVALVPLAGMDVFLHWRSQASAEGLRTRLAERAVVVRDGRRVELSAVEVVPGDLTVVAPGEAFPCRWPGDPGERASG
jgi:Ca2+-transporting ATPase